MEYSIDDLAAALGRRFRAFQLIGKGGEGAVFSVWDRIQRQDVALKLTRDTGEAGVAERFEREYHILATTRSPRLVTVYRHGKASIRGAGGEVVSHFWYSMEKCDSNVRREIRRLRLSQRLEVGMQMIEGLSLLHAKNIAHRDIKPENLFLTLSGDGAAVKIGDFGLATVTRIAPNAVGGVVLGSPGYLAPERWTGDGDADWRPADQYAAGVTLFEVLSGGALPFEARRGEPGKGADAGIAALAVPELRGRGVPQVDKVIARMTASRPERRFVDLAECKRALGAALAMEGVG